MSIATAHSHHTVHYSYMHVYVFNSSHNNYLRWESEDDEERFLWSSLQSRRHGNPCTP